MSLHSPNQPRRCFWYAGHTCAIQTMLLLLLFITLKRLHHDSNGNRNPATTIQGNDEHHWELNNTSSEHPFKRRPAILPRALPEEAWKKKVQKGRDIYCAFSMPVETVQQSSWLKWSALSDWGWHDTTYKDFYVENGMDDVTALVHTLEPFMKEHKYDTALDKGMWQDSNMGHDQDYTWPGSDRKEQHTGAQYSAWLTKQDLTRPLWLRQSSYAPAFEIQKQGLVKVQPPKLQRWSDISALQYYRLMGGNPDGSSKVIAPRMIVIPQIVRGEGKTDTLDTIDKAHELIYEPLSDWPGILFKPETEHDVFYGLLGTAHGSGPAYFLAQHKLWFGNMKIESIQVWAVPQAKPIYHMAFSIVAAAESE